MATRLPERVAERLFRYVTQQPSYLNAVRELAAAYVGYFRDWHPTDEERRRAKEAVLADVGVEFELSPKPPEARAFLRLAPRFNRAAEPVLPHPEGVTDEEAVRILERLVAKARHKPPVLVLTITARVENGFLVFDSSA